MPGAISCMEPGRAYSATTGRRARSTGAPVRISSPLRVGLGRADLLERGVVVGLDREVAERDDSDRLAVVVHDGQAAYLVLAHQLDRVAERGVGGDRRSVGRADVLDARV